MSDETQERLPENGPERICHDRLRCLGVAVVSLERAVGKAFPPDEPGPAAPSSVAGPASAEPDIDIASIRAGIARLQGDDQMRPAA